MARKAHFTVFGRFDGAPKATVTIEDHGGVQFFRVRPFRRRRSFDLLLPDVARGVIFDVTKKELAQKRKEKKARKSL